VSTALSYGGGGANPESERESRRDGEPGALAKEPETESEVAVKLHRGFLSEC
jgi:hypothetical protein